MQLQLKRLGEQQEMDDGPSHGNFKYIDPMYKAMAMIDVRMPVITTDLYGEFITRCYTKVPIV